MMKRRFEPQILLAARSLAAFFVFSGGLTSCKDKSTSSNVAYIIGPTNDITPISNENSSSVPTEIFNATGLIVTKLQGDKVKFCSGTLAAPERPGENLRVLTNHHCFADADDRGNASDLLLVEACTGTEIYIGFSPELGQAPQRGKCKPGSLRTNPVMDLAIFTLTKALPDYNQPLEIWEGDPIPEGRPALIVHYPDNQKNVAIPPGQRTQLPTASITNKNCQVSTIFAQDDWELDRSLPYGMRHTCDLIHGSSGSPLIDSATKKIIGINWGGIKIKRDGVEKADNVATRAVFIKQFIAGSVDTSATSSNPALDAIASQRAAATSNPKKNTKLPLGCGVASESQTNPMVLFGLMALPLLLLFGFQNRFAKVRLKTPTSTTASSIITLLALGFSLYGQEASSQDSSSRTTASSTATAHLVSIAFSQEYLFTPDSLLSTEMKSKACFAAKVSQSRNLILPMQKEFLAKKHSEELTDLICASMPSLKLVQWNKLEQNLSATGVKCDSLKVDLDAFVNLQASLGADNSGSATRLLAYATNLNEQRLSCLVTALSSSKALAEGNLNFDPLPLVLALQKSNHPIGNAATATGQLFLQVTSIRYIQASNYPEALRTLITLLDYAPEWRSIYDSIQRVYNFRQKGKGSVALNQ